MRMKDSNRLHQARKKKAQKWQLSRWSKVMKETKTIFLNEIERQKQTTSY
uniref:Uncharacterized protein n=1 Tax=Arion vulgaris TaxID=1028688 RepID=A0A0B6ZHU3_9EUPU